MQYNLSEDPLPDEVAPLIFYGRTGCQRQLEGDAPSGRCYSFLEDWRGKPGFDSWRSAGFSLTFVTLNEQLDGTLFWTYQQGPIGTAWGYLSRPPQAPPKSEDIGIPLGAVLSVVPLGANDLPSRFSGSWVGNNYTNHLPEAGSDFGAQVNLQIREGGCGFLNDVYTVGIPFFRETCGVITFPESGFQDNFIYQSRVECFEYVQGPAAVSECYLFKSTRQDLRLHPECWDEDSNRFMSVSVQEGGDLFLAHVYGTVVKASGILSQFCCSTSRGSVPTSTIY